MKPLIQLVGAGLVGLLVLVFPASAAGPTDSIVYIKSNNVWLAKANGLGRVRLTRDGTAANPYYSPTQVDNGTIVALRGPDGRAVVATYSGGGSKVYRLSSTGKLLGKPRITLFEALPALVSRAVAAEVSPNGRTLAISQLLYETVTRNGRRELKAVALNVVYTDVASGKYKGKSELVLQQLGSPSWIDNSRLLVFDQFSQAGAHVYVTRVGKKPVPFFRDPERSTLVPDWNANSLGAGELTRRGDKLALVRAKIDGAGAPAIELYAARGVSAPPAHRCTLGGRDINLEPGLSWSPDGSTLSWYEDSGIWSTPVKLDAPNCGVAPRLVIRGGLSPD